MSEKVVRATVSADVRWIGTCRVEGPQCVQWHIPTFAHGEGVVVILESEYEMLKAAQAPGSVKALIDALEAEFKLDVHLAACKLCGIDGFCEEGDAISEAGTALKHKALAPFKGTQTTYYGAVGLDSIKQFGAE